MNQLHTLLNASEAEGDILNVLIRHGQKAVPKNILIKLSGLPKSTASDAVARLGARRLVRRIQNGLNVSIALNAGQLRNELAVRRRAVMTIESAVARATAATAAKRRVR